MKASLFILALSFALFLAAPFAHAQLQDNGSSGTGAGTPDSGGSLLLRDSGPASANCTGIPCQSAENPPSSGDPTQQANSTNPAGNGNKNQTVDAYQAFGPIFGFFMQLAAWLLGVAAVLLNDAVIYTVVKMGTILNANQGGLSAVAITWRVLRDIGNIVLIFAFVAIGIDVILDADGFGYQKLLVKLLMVSVLLNFSLFISEAIVDTGNIFATQFYTQINNGQLPSPQGANDIAGKGIANAIIQSVELQTLYDVNKGHQAGTGLTGAFNSVTDRTILFTAILSILLFVTAAFVLFSIAFLFIGRFVILVILIVIAPIGFAGLLVPKLDKYAQKWWDYIIQQTLTAPVLLLLLYIALAVITDKRFLSSFGVTPANGWSSVGDLGNTVASGASASQVSLNGFAGIELAFLVAMGLLMMCVYVANALSAYGGKTATRWAGSLSFGLLAWTGQNTLGWASNAGARLVRKSPLGRIPLVGRGLASTLDAGAKATYDVRGTGVFKAAGIDAGDVRKGGYRKAEEESIKARETYAKSLGLSHGEKEAIKDLEKEQREAVARGERERATMRGRHADDRKDLEGEVNARRKEAADARSRGDKGALRDAELALNNAQLSLNKVIDEQKEELSKLDKAYDTLDKAYIKSVADAKSAPQTKFAKFLLLGRDNADDMWFNRWVNPSRYTVAAENILKNAKKSKQDTDNEAIVSALRDAASKMGESKS